MNLDQALPIQLRVLIIEDVEDDAILMVENLRNNGFNVDYLQVDNRKSLEMSLTESWDVALCDHNLPTFSSYEVLECIRNRKDILLPTIVVSGAIGEEHSAELIRKGAYDYILKDNLTRLPYAVEQAIESKRLRLQAQESQREIQESHEQTRLLAEHLTQVREEERHRIARDIHDELGSNLAALKMDTHWLKRRTGDDKDINNKLDAMSSLLDSSVKALRRILEDLRPSIIDDLGLFAAMEWQFATFKERLGIRGHIHTPDELLFLPRSEYQISLFRIFQESLNNVAKHAKADEVIAEVTYTDKNLLEISISDNGVGMSEDTAFTVNRRSFGLIGMRERVKQMGGTILVYSQPGQGTKVLVQVPRDLQ